MLELEATVKDRSVAVSDDSLGGGVGGFSMGVRPLASERWGSRRRWPSAVVFRSGFARVPDTVDMRFGINMGSGIYSLILRFLVCGGICGCASPPSGCCLVSSMGGGNDVSPVYPFFVFFAGVL